MSKTGSPPRCLAICSRPPPPDPPPITLTLPSANHASGCVSGRGLARTYDWLLVTSRRAWRGLADALSRGQPTGDANFLKYYESRIRCRGAGVTIEDKRIETLCMRLLVGYRCASSLIAIAGSAYTIHRLVSSDILRWNYPAAAYIEKKHSRSCSSLRPTPKRFRPCRPGQSRSPRVPRHDRLEDPLPGVANTH